MPPLFPPGGHLGLDIEELQAIPSLDELVHLGNVLVDPDELSPNLIVIVFSPRRVPGQRNALSDRNELSLSLVSIKELVSPPALGTLGVEIRNGLAVELEVVEEPRPLCLLDPPLDEIHQAAATSFSSRADQL